MNKIIVSRKYGQKYYLRYAITLTIHPVIAMKEYHPDQYDLAVHALASFLPKITDKRCIVSFELTNDYNIHVHLLMYMDNPTSIRTIRNYLDIYLKDTIFGHYWVTPCYDEGWISYINKKPYFVELYRYAF